jgi:hypothetical protein
MEMVRINLIIITVIIMGDFGDYLCPNQTGTIDGGGEKFII